MARSLAVLLALVAVSAASAQPAAVRIVHRGETVRLAASPSGNPACLAAVGYADGKTINAPIKDAVLGKVSWSIRIPSNAAYGLAHWSVRCGPTWQQGGTWRVVARTLPPPVVSVTKAGFSQRPDRTGAGSTVSLGLLLANPSAKRDAKNVYLLVNAVDGAGRLLGSLSRTVPLVAAGQTFAYGAELTLRTQATVRRLEVTARAGAGAAALPHLLPHVANVKVVTDPQDPGWVSEVDGEIANDTTARTMTSARLSLVVLNATGDVVGGGTATVTSPLPAGSRTLFATQAGVGAIPSARAASVVVTAVPQYQAG